MKLFPLSVSVEENYMCTVIRNRCRAPRYFPILWNVHECVLNKEDQIKDHE